MSRSAPAGSVRRRRAHLTAPADSIADVTLSTSASDGCKAVKRDSFACSASHVVCNTDSSALVRPSDSVRNERNSSTMPPLWPSSLRTNSCTRFIA